MIESTIEKDGVTVDRSFVPRGTDASRPTPEIPLTG
jgi:hypothetical protein